MNCQVNENSCLFGEDVVGYIYNELTVSDRAVFEDHLLDCVGCTSEFASIAEARLGVYEWHRDAFLPLATPQFVLDFELRPSIVFNDSTWSEAIRGWLSPSRFAIAGTAFTVAVLALAAYLVIVVPGDELVAEATRRVTPIISFSDEASVVDRGPAVIATNNSEQSFVRPIVTQKQRSSASMHLRKAAKSVQSKQESQSAQFAAAPSLGSYVEMVDNSLRLSDLVADIDTY